MVVKSILADLMVEYHTLHEKVEKQLKEYLFDFSRPDLFFEIKQSDIDEERHIDIESASRRNDRMLEITVAFRKLAEKLPMFDGAVFHSCLIGVNNRAIAFSASSGTGKTTHMLRWQKLLGENLTIINGDKPILRFVDDKLYGYGSPWMGKEWMGCNKKELLTDICKIERSETNETIPLSKDEAIELLMQQIYMPFDPQMRLKTIALVYRIAEKVKFWKIKCNMDLEAAEVAYKVIFNK